jgi:hypothetical protein
MNFRRALGPLLAILLLIGVGVAVTYSIRERTQAHLAMEKAQARITVKILTGSEKEHFLEDPQGIFRLFTEHSGHAKRTAAAFAAST